MGVILQNNQLTREEFWRLSKLFETRYEEWKSKSRREIATLAAAILKFEVTDNNITSVAQITGLGLRPCVNTNPRGINAWRVVVGEVATLQKALGVKPSEAFQKFLDDHNKEDEV